MKQFSSIFQFEFFTIVKNKIYIIITVAAVVIIGILLSFNQIKSSFSSDDDIGTTDGDIGTTETETSKIAIKNESKLDNDTLYKMFAEVFEDNIVLTTKSLDEVKDLITKNEYDACIYIKTEKSYDYIVNDITMFDRTTDLIDGLLKDLHTTQTLKKAGMSENEIINFMSFEVESDVIAIRVNQADNYFYTYMLLILLFMAIIMYGTLVATSVATEKSTRTMEILITSAKPKNLIFGKVLGAGVAGLMQFLIIILSAFLFFRINSGSLEEDSLVSLMFNMPAKTMVFAVIFFVGGYFMYAFLYGAFASLVSRTEDINMVAMPLQMIITVAYLLVMMAVISGNINGIVMKVLSFIPLTSPMAMFVRISMGGPTAIEITVSVVLLLLGILLTGYISAGMYRLGVLMYGKSPKPTEVYKIMKQSILNKD